MKDISSASTAVGSVDHLLSWTELREIIPYSRVQIWRLEREGGFPARITLGQNRVAWSLTEVQSWIEARKAARRTSAPDSATPEISQSA